MKKVLVLGGGFAGVEAAIDLSKQHHFDVTLISNRNFLYLFPISIWIPTHTTEFENAKIPLQQISTAHGFKLKIGNVETIKAKDGVLVCDSEDMTFDYLLIALGAAKLKPTGVEHTLSICGQPETSLQIREALDQLVNKGSGKIAMGFGGNPKDKSAVRGGPGFELLFNVHNYLRKKGIRQNFDLSFFAPMENPGIKMGTGALDMIDQMFNKYNIHKFVGKKIKTFVNDGIILEDDSKISSDLTMFIPASTGSELIRNNSDLPLNDSGFIKIDDHGLVQGFDNVFAAGDAATLEGASWAAKQGHMAEIMGRNAAFNILHHDQGDMERRGYQEQLSIICVMDTGDGAAFVYRSKKRNFIIPMPIIGHWLKKGWASYIKLTKTGKIPRIPGI